MVANVRATRTVSLIGLCLFVGCEGKEPNRIISSEVWNAKQHAALPYGQMLLLVKTLEGVAGGHAQAAKAKVVDVVYGASGLEGAIVNLEFNSVFSERFMDAPLKPIAKGGDLLVIATMEDGELKISADEFIFGRKTPFVIADQSVRESVGELADVLSEYDRLSNKNIPKFLSEKLLSARDTITVCWAVEALCRIGDTPPAELHDLIFRADAPAERLLYIDSVLARCASSKWSAADERLTLLGRIANVPLAFKKDRTLASAIGSAQQLRHKPNAPLDTRIVEVIFTALQNEDISRDMKFILLTALERAVEASDTKTAYPVERWKQVSRLLRDENLIAKAATITRLTE